MKNFILTFLAFIILVSCSEKRRGEADENIEQKNNTLNFQSKYENLEILPLPVKWTSEIWSIICENYLKKQSSLDNSKSQYHPFAKLNIHSNYNAIVFISSNETNAPVIVTFDNIGHPIDTLILMGDWGNNDPSIYTNELVVINKDLTINLIDSTTFYKVDSEGKRIENSAKKKVKIVFYKISKNGKIKKIN